MKSLPLKFLIKLIAIAAFIFFLGPPVLSGIKGIVQFVNPGRALMDRLTEDNKKLKKLNGDFIVERDSINTALQIAQTLTTTKENELEEALKRAADLAGAGANLSGIIDSLKDELSSVSEGSGSVVIVESGKLIDGKYKDDWINLQVFGRQYEDTRYYTMYDSIAYKFDFTIGDVRVSLEDNSDNIKTVYSVWIQSNTNPANRIFIDNYYVTEVKAKDFVHRWDWWDVRPALAVQVVDNTQLSLGISTFSYNPNPFKGEDGNLLRFPYMSGLSDFKTDHSLGISILVNAGYFLPIFHNLQVMMGYSIGTRSGAIVGLGAVL